jgi:uncharacterized membrane protein YfcA
LFDLNTFTNVFNNFSSVELVFATILLFIAAVIRGLTGFGFSAIIVTGLSFIVPPSQTVILALLLEIVASIHLMPKAWSNIDWKLLGALGSGVLLGTPIGMTLLAFAAPDTMRLIISSLVMVFSLLILKGFSYRGPRNFSVHGALGLVSGVCNGTAALGGLPVVTFLLSTDAQVAATRATLIALFFTTDIYALIFAGGHGLVSSAIFIYAFTALPILVFGVALGQRLFNVASPQVFKRIALFLLLVLSLTGIIRAIMTLL